MVFLHPKTPRKILDLLHQSEDLQGALLTARFAQASAVQKTLPRWTPGPVSPGFSRSHANFPMGAPAWKMRSFCINFWEGIAYCQAYRVSPSQRSTSKICWLHLFPRNPTRVPRKSQRKFLWLLCRNTEYSSIFNAPKTHLQVPPVPPP